MDVVRICERSERLRVGHEFLLNNTKTQGGLHGRSRGCTTSCLEGAQVPSHRVGLEHRD